MKHDFQQTVCAVSPQEMTASIESKLVYCQDQISLLLPFGNNVSLTGRDNVWSIKLKKKKYDQ